MVSLASLWLPIVLSAVVVFVASSVIHMVLGYHRSDFRKLASEDEVMKALRGFKIPPGDYMMPRAENSAEMRSPEYTEKTKQGPVAMLTVMADFGMGKSLALWFVYCLVVGVFAGYVTVHAASAGAHYLEVFRFVGTTAFMGYALALAQNSIWYKRSWMATFKSMFDGLIYALLTAGTFGWLWPG